MATLEQLEQALINADKALNAAQKAGDVGKAATIADDARRLAKVLVDERARIEAQGTPDLDEFDLPSTVPPPPEAPGVADIIAGTGEAALTLATGATGGTVGMIEGAIEGMTREIASGQFGSNEAANRIEELAAKRAASLTYAPRWQAGQQIVRGIGEIAAPLTPLAPMVSELGAIAQGAKAVAPIIAGKVIPTLQEAGQGIANAAKQSTAALGEALRRERPQPVATGMGGSVGAAMTSGEAQRRATAASLPVPVELTKGAATRDAAQLAFEKEMMKSAEFGAPFRDRAEKNNFQLFQNIDAMIDATGTKGTGDPIQSSRGLISALSEGLEKSKNKVRVLYKVAKDSDEAKAIVDLAKPITLAGDDDALKNTTIARWLDSKIVGLESSGFTDTARKQALKLGILTESGEPTKSVKKIHGHEIPVGSLKPKQGVTVLEMENFRKEISGKANLSNPGQIRDETILKQLIDASTKAVEGDNFRKARAARAQIGRLYENRGIIANLIEMKRGMDDPRIAIDKVFNRVILNSSPDELKFLKRVTSVSSKQGKEVWNDMRAATFRYMQEESFKGPPDSVGRNTLHTSRLNTIVNSLDRKGALDVIFTPKQAQLIRDLNTIAKDVSTVPPGTLINNSGTAMTLMTALAEAGTTGAMTGLPVPVISLLKQASRHVKDTKTRKRIQDALGE